jgi:predicted acyltransferase
MTLTATAATGDAPTRSAALPGTRLISLDVFRGITIAGMLLVNNPGSWAHVYPPLLHAEWHGWTPTDLIFPFFLFIVGVSMTLSFGRRMERGADRGDLFLHAARRAAILVALGLVLNGFPSYDLSSIRLPGCCSGSVSPT